MPDRKNAFTLIEFLIVITVVMILAATAITGSTGVIQNLRFGNAFNKMVFMVQQARNLALTAKGKIPGYQIKFDNKKIELFTTEGNDKKLDTLNLPAQGITYCVENLSAGATPSVTLPSCNCNSASIGFTSGTAKTILSCAGQNVAFMRFGIKTTDNTRQKFFTIHAATGIPQILN